MGEELKRLTALVNNTEKKVNNDNIITASVGINPNGLKQDRDKDDEKGQLASLINAHNRPSLENKGEKRKIDDMKEEGQEDDDSVFLPNDRNNEDGDKTRNKRNRPAEPKPGGDWDIVDQKTGKNGENKSTPDHNMMYHQHGQRFGDHTGNQQQEVFAFSTFLANRAAQSVLSGNTNSIINYHQTQSASRKFLQAEQEAQDKTPPSSADSGVAHTSSNNSPEDQSSSRQGTPIPLGTPDSKTQDILLKPMDCIEPKECRTTPKGNASGTPEAGNSTPSNSVHNETHTPVSSVLDTSTPTPPTTTKKTGRKRKTSKGANKMLQQQHHHQQQQQQQQQHHQQQQHYGPHVNQPFQGHFPPQYNLMSNPFHTDMQMSFPSNQRISPVGVPQPSTTETEDLSPSALWENIPTKKIPGPGAWKPHMDMMPNMQNSMMGHPRMNAPGKMVQRPLMRPAQFHQPSHGSMGVNLPFGPTMTNSDENLTPDQLRHRQEQLRKITDMKRLLLQDKPGNQMMPPRMMSPGGMPTPEMMMMQDNPMMGMMRPPGPGMMEPSQRIMMSPTPGMAMSPQHMPMMPQDDMMSPEQRMMMQPPMNNDWENATPAQKAWVKLQHEYYQEKQQTKIIGKQNIMNLGGPNMPMDSHDPMGDFGMNQPGMPGGGNVPPPPPYHGPQTPFGQRQNMPGSFPIAGGMPSNNMPLSPNRLIMPQQAGSRTNRAGNIPGIPPQMPFPRSQGNMNMPMSPTPTLQSNSGLDSGMTGGMMEQSPRPGHPGTPGMENFATPRSNSSNNINPMSQPNVPSPQMPKPNTSTTTTGIPTPLSNTSEANVPKTTADSNQQQMAKTSEAQMGQPQRLVNFPPSQLNRDKAPNFPPRGEEQFASNFYQKSMEKKQSARLQHFNQSNMAGGGPDMMPSPQPGMMSSHANMMSPQPGMMSSKGGMIALTSPGQNMGQGGMMPQQRMNPSQAQMRMMPQDMMASHALPTSQSNMMSSHSGMMPSQSVTMNSQSDMMTSSQGMMSPMGMMPQQPGFMGNQRTIVSPGHNMPPGMNMPNMGNHGLMNNPGNMPGGMGIMSDMGMPNMGMPNEGNMGHGMMPDHPMAASSLPNDIMSMQQPGNTIMRNANRPMISSHNQVPLPASLPIDASSRTTPNMTGQKMAGVAATNTPSSGDGQNPLAILQNRFEPPLLPDGKGPKQTLQYFPTPDAQAQSGNPHLNPGMNTGPVSQPPSQGPKQIQMPFPMDMVRPGMQGMNQGYVTQRMSGPRMSHTDSMFQQQMAAMPRNQIPGMYNMPRQMQPDMFGPGTRHRMMNPNMMGQQPMGGFGDSMMGGPQGPGAMMAMNNPMMQYQNMPNM